MTHEELKEAWKVARIKAEKRFMYSYSIYSCVDIWQVSCYTEWTDPMYKIWFEEMDEKYG